MDPSFGVAGKVVVSLAPTRDLFGTALATRCGSVVAGNAIDRASPDPPGFGVVRLTR